MHGIRKARFHARLLILVVVVGALASFAATRAPVAHADCAGVPDCGELVEGEVIAQSSGCDNNNLGTRDCIALTGGGQVVSSATAQGLIVSSGSPTYGKFTIKLWAPGCVPGQNGCTPTIWKQSPTYLLQDDGTKRGWKWCNTQGGVCQGYFFAKDTWLCGGFIKNSNGQWLVSGSNGACKKIIG